MLRFFREKKKRIILRPVGSVYNLQEIYNALNKEYFDAKLDLRISWFGRGEAIPKTRITFGGGFGTDGDVSVGQTLNLGLGVEVSLTEHWVFATDFAYAYSRETTFKGNPGQEAPGMPASVGGPSSDQFSIAPAIEYNVSDRGGFIGGVWFSVTGRNSANFVGLVLSYTWLF